MASPNTNTRTPNPSNPSSLKPRYEIRRLEAKHIPWASAIIVHSNMFYSPVWPRLYPEGKGARCHEGQQHMRYLVEHQINSGLSFGVFDTEYQFKREESKATDGALYWNPSEPSIEDAEGTEAESARLLEQMDFPLVSVALSYDAYNALDMPRMKPLMSVLPHFGLIYFILGEGDKRDPDPSIPSGPGEVLKRNATSTRHEYEGQNIMAGLARWLMREAASKGYRGIQIECVADSVTHVWSNPPAPFKGSVVSEFDTRTWKDAEGNLAFAPAEQRITKVYCQLKP